MLAGEEALAGSQNGAGLLPKRFHAIQNRMEGEGQQIQRDKGNNGIMRSPVRAIALPDGRTEKVTADSVTQAHQKFTLDCLAQRP